MFQQMTLFSKMDILLLKKDKDIMHRTQPQNPDQLPQKVIAFYEQTGSQSEESPYHHHHKGQLVFLLSGFLRCKIQDAIWVVPPHHAVWIPSQAPHCNMVAPQSEVCMVLCDPEIAEMPDQVYTLTITPLLRELILHLTKQPKGDDLLLTVPKIVDVLFDELVKMPVEKYQFPIPQDPRLSRIAFALLDSPWDRKTIKEWAQESAMSEKTLSRLIKQQTGLTFGRWKGQLHIVVAIQLLNSGYTVQYVATELGYESVSAFIQFFKKTLGHAPKKYIKMTHGDL